MTLVHFIEFPGRWGKNRFFAKVWRKSREASAKVQPPHQSPLSLGDVLEVLGKKKLCQRRVGYLIPMRLTKRYPQSDVHVAPLKFCIGLAKDWLKWSFYPRRWSFAEPGILDNHQVDFLSILVFPNELPNWKWMVQIGIEKWVPQKFRPLKSKYFI